MSQTTFVTAFLQIYENPHEGLKNYDDCFNLFNNILDSNANICLFLSKCFAHKGNELLQKYKNLRIYYTELEDLLIYNELKNFKNLSLPSNRKENKDTYNYLTLMNAKLELLLKIIQIDPFQSTHFSWIDFRFFHCVKDIPNSVQSLKNLVNSKLKNKMLCIPGMWPKQVLPKEWILNNVCWRFCGTFLIGDRLSVKSLCELFFVNFPLMLQEFKTLIWEVNVWSMFESFLGFKINWYQSDHDEGMLQLPKEYYL